MRVRVSILSGLVMVLAWIIPNHYYPWTSFYHDFLAFSALWLLLLCFCRERFAVSPSVIFVVLLSLVPLLQVLGGVIVFSGDGLIASLYLLGFAVALLVGRQLTQWSGYSSFEYVGWVLLAGAFFSGWIAISQFLEVGRSIWLVDLKPGGRPFANLSQPNNLATLLMLGLAALLYLHEKRRLGAVASSALALCLLSGLALTQSRTPWVGCVCLLIWRSINYKHAGLSIRNYVLFGWVVCYVGILFSLPYLAGYLQLTELDIARRASESVRLDMWGQMVVAIVDGPLWGYGWNQVSFAQLAVTLAKPVQAATEHGHNIILDLLIWNGPIIGGLVVFACVIWVGRLAFSVRTAEETFALLAVGLILLHGLLEFPLEYAYFLIPLGILIGLLEGQQKVGSVIFLPKGGGVPLLLVGGAVLGAIWYEYRIVEDNHRLMRFHAVGIGREIKGKPAPDVVVLTQLWSFTRFAGTPAREGMTKEEIGWMRNVAYRYPYPPSLFRYTLALALNGYNADAVQEMKRLRALHGESIFSEARQGVIGMAVTHPQLRLFSVEIQQWQ
ncbi:hypothetical protein B6S59_15100 [Pseudomonas sp. A46]|nr:O-antigen ligase family protein [Pseudomonas sp. A46]OWJ94155.1 hypothetical protein B6S59_15100 [Pseudomonas sp. A46]